MLRIARRLAPSAATFCLALAGCRTTRPIALALDPGVDPSQRAAIAGWVADGRARAEAFFGAPFVGPFRVTVAADRTTLTARWRILFRAPTFDSECWMVGAGVASELSLLAPSRWRDQACDHDPDDPDEPGLLVAHELVHVYQSQRNATLETGGESIDAIGWFVEGLAVYASGQLARGHLAPASEAIARGFAPIRLATAWSGKYRYAVSGSLVAYIDHAFGRALLVRLLTVTSQGDLLAALGLDEATLLERWRAFVERTRQ